MVSSFFPMVGDFYFTALKQNILKSILLPTKRFFLDLWWLLFPKVKFLFSCYPWQAPRQPVSCPFCFVAVWQQYLLPRLQLYWHSWAEGIHFTFTLPSPKSAWCCAIYIIYHLSHDSKTTQGWLQHYPGWEENDFFFFFFFPCVTVSITLLIMMKTLCPWKSPDLFDNLCQNINQAATWSVFLCLLLCHGSSQLAKFSVTNGRQAQRQRCRDGFSHWESDDF